MDLKSVLETMGLTEAFSDTGDFSSMTDERIWLGDVRQQSHISLDEKGVEAAAYTAIAYAGAAMPLEEVVELILDRPFLYGISHNGTLVFVGVCQNPEK